MPNLRSRPSRWSSALGCALACIAACTQQRPDAERPAAPAPVPVAVPAPSEREEQRARLEELKRERAVAIEERLKAKEAAPDPGPGTTTDDLLDGRRVVTEDELREPGRRQLNALRTQTMQSVEIIRSPTRSPEASRRPSPVMDVAPAPTPPPPSEDVVSPQEGYRFYGVNPFVETKVDRLSTFGIDVDTASYAIARRKIHAGVLPPRDGVRVEEFVNAFRYDLPAPSDGAPFTVSMDAAPSPFEKGRHLLRVALQGRRVPISERKRANLVFLVDVSGSMQSPDKLPLAQRALRILVDNLRDGDTVSLVTYAGGVREVLPPTGLASKGRIYEAIDSLVAGGSTGMASGIELAYRNAAKTLSADSTSRVLILSDGDANVGPTSPEELLKLIARHVKEGVTLSVVGFGMGNYKDDRMEQFADKGNGNYSYVDTIMEARKVFQTQLGGTLEVIAEDTKIQVEFNPEAVRRYRLIGYENRDLADRAFRDDKVDAGEVGSGHSVTALYELELAPGAATQSLATVRVRAKPPRGATAAEWAFAFAPAALAATFDGASADFRFATAVMAAAEIFRQSAHARAWPLAEVERIAAGAGGDRGERKEFLDLVREAKAVQARVATR